VSDEAGGGLVAWRERVDADLAGALGPCRDGLREAMGYSLLGAGKRLRPLMVLSAAHAVAPEPPELAWRAAIAVECLHAYSLIHDDLPSMDDDDVRRGRPTLHKAYDEATAILAGDALQALAFAQLAVPARSGADARRALRLVAELGAAAGGAGMVAGQYLDLRLEAAAAAERVGEMHRLKTGALFRAAARMGGLAAGGRARQMARLTAFGEAFGVMYQALDDLADEAGDAERPSLVRALGRDGARRAAAAAATAAETAARAMGERGGALSALVRLVSGVAA
jgi:geranylgeranyl pyrophosphate synthase